MIFNIKFEVNTPCCFLINVPELKSILKKYRRINFFIPKHYDGIMKWRRVIDVDQVLFVGHRLCKP
jgi:hypothetical protein